jgi:hypothetical protein
MKYQQVKFNKDCNHIICNIKNYPFTGPDPSLGFQEVDAAHNARVHPQ